MGEHLPSFDDAIAGGMNNPAIEAHHEFRAKPLSLKMVPRSVPAMDAETDRATRAATIRFLAKSLAASLLRKHGENEAAKRVWE